MARLLTQSPVTELEYLRLEREAEFKSEFHDGQIFAMAGVSPNHSLLANSIGAILRSHVPKGYVVFNSNLRISIPSAKLYTYADSSVICSPLQLADDQKDCLLNPLLIVEILSPSTEGYDRGKKFELYRGISSFQEYLMIHQDRAHIEHYSKQTDASWLLREHTGLGALVSLSSLNVHILLSDLYAQTGLT